MTIIVLFFNLINYFFSDSSEAMMTVFFFDRRSRKRRVGLTNLDEPPRALTFEHPFGLVFALLAS
jgi:hypothetical protein